MDKGSRCINPDLPHVAKVPEGYNGSFAIRSGYYKKGDDYHAHLTVAKNNPIKALADWGADLQQASKRLEELAAVLTKHKARIKVVAADTHLVLVKGRNRATQSLLYDMAASGKSNVIQFNDYIRCEGDNGWEHTSESDED